MNEEGAQMQGMFERTAERLAADDANRARWLAEKMAQEPKPGELCKRGHNDWVFDPDLSHTRPSREAGSFYGPFLPRYSPASWPRSLSCSPGRWALRPSSSSACWRLIMATGSTGPKG